MKQTHLCDIVFFVLSPVLCLGEKAIKSLKVDSVRLDVAWQSSRAVQDREKLVQCVIGVTDCIKVVVAFCSQALLVCSGVGQVCRWGQALWTMMFVENALDAVEK